MLYFYQTRCKKQGEKRPTFFIDGYRQDIENVIYDDEIAMEDESSPKQILDDILYRLATDKDRDARFYISDFVSQEELESYHKKKAVEDLQVAEDISQELATKVLPPPPPPPAHLVKLPLATEHEDIASPHQVVADLEEQEKENKNHADQLASADSPMDIVNDDDVATDKAEETEQEKDVDEIMTDVMCLSEEGDYQLEEHFEDEEDEDDDNATEKKARHIYLSKTPAHALNDTNVVLSQAPSPPSLPPTTPTLPPPATSVSTSSSD